MNEYPTNAVSSKIQSLLYGKANLPSAFQNFLPECDAGLEPCGDRSCHRLEGGTSDFYLGSGKQVNVRKLTVWIEADTYLVRKVIEDVPSSKSGT